MKQVQISRIKAAGKNITIVGYLMLVSCILPFVAVFHYYYYNLKYFAIDQIETFFGIYGTLYLVLSIAIITNVFFAGKNLNLCDAEEEEKKIVERQIAFIRITGNRTLRIITVNNETIGAEVYMENEIAPDGEYQYLNDKRKLIVKDGKIERILS